MKLLRSRRVKLADIVADATFKHVPHRLPPQLSATIYPQEHAPTDFFARHRRIRGIIECSFEEVAC